MKRFLPILALALLVAAPAYASEVTGTLSTGIASGIAGVVDAAPTASPAPGTYTSAQSVTLTAADATSIHYTIDSSPPTCTTGTVYSGAIAVNVSETIRAVACFGTVASPVGTFAYGINITVPTPPSNGNGNGGGGGGSTPPTTTVSGDINHDGVIDIGDFNALIVSWGKTGPNLVADLNHDGVVDILDFNMLIIGWSV